MSANGGTYAKAAVAFLKAVLLKDDASRKLFTDKDSPLIADGWEIVSKNF